MQRLAKGLFLLRPDVLRQTLGATSKIADAHGAGVAVAVHLPEGLHLHRTGK